MNVWSTLTSFMSLLWRPCSPVCHTWAPPPPWGASPPSGHRPQRLTGQPLLTWGQVFNLRLQQAEPPHEDIDVPLNEGECETCPCPDNWSFNVIDDLQVEEVVESELIKTFRWWKHKVCDDLWPQLVQQKTSHWTLSLCPCCVYFLILPLWQSTPTPGSVFVLHRCSLVSSSVMSSSVAPHETTCVLMCLLIWLLSLLFLFLLLVSSLL